MKRSTKVSTNLDRLTPFDGRKKIPREDVKQYPASLR